ncbi:MAG TPA: isochorismatase family protein [Pseudonocardiaceae bacterium]|nr:isochorismatase family protein [Pseudonocardiaceae bacterium]
MSVLLMVDTQRNMLLPPSPVPSAEAVGKAIAQVLAQARESGAQVIHIRNTGGAGDPDEPGTDGWELAYPVADGEHVVDKPECDAFVGTDLATLIPSGASIVVVGMQSEYCVRSTTLGALSRNHPVTVVHGAHATYPADRAATQISTEIEAELSKAGAIVLDLDTVRFERKLTA